MQDYRLDHNGDWFSINMCHFILQKNTNYKDTETDKKKKRQYITERSVKTADSTSLGTIVHFGIDYKTIRSK